MCSARTHLLTEEISTKLFPISTRGLERRVSVTLRCAKGSGGTLSTARKTLRLLSCQGGKATSKNQGQPQNYLQPSSSQANLTYWIGEFNGYENCSADINGEQVGIRTSRLSQLNSRVPNLAFRASGASLRKARRHPRLESAAGGHRDSAGLRRGAEALCSWRAADDFADA